MTIFDFVPVDEVDLLDDFGARIAAEAENALVVKVGSARAIVG